MQLKSVVIPVNSTDTSTRADSLSRYVRDSEACGGAGGGGAGGGGAGGGGAGGGGAGGGGPGDGVGEGPGGRPTTCGAVTVVTKLTESVAFLLSITA